MSGNTRQVVICVDIGMTGSAACWRHYQSTSSWTLIWLKKIPTSVAYEANGDYEPPLNWGSRYAVLPNITVKECFKAYIGASSFETGPALMPGAPRSRPELDRWISDYLGAFCGNIVAYLDQNRECDGWRDVISIWNFTVPGSWPLWPVVADFRALVEKAVLCYCPKAQILCDVTEARASAQCVLVKRYAIVERPLRVGSMIVTCDIGGLTTDVALSIVSSAGRLTTWPLSNIRSAGIAAIEKEFWLHVYEILHKAGAPDARQIALGIVQSADFQYERAVFMRQRKKSVKFALPFSLRNLHWSDPTDTRMSTLHDGVISIPSDMFESFFAIFAQQIEAAIDEAFKIASEMETHPVILGFCGGGSHIAYAIDRFRRRYEVNPRGENVLITNHSDLTVASEMASVIGACLLWDERELDEYVKQTAFGIETSDCVRWCFQEASMEASKTDRSYPWVVKFNCKGRRRTERSRIIAVMSTPDPPDSFSSALQLPGAHSWIVEVDLGRHRPKGFLRSQLEYRLVCNIARPYDVDFTAKVIDTGEDLPCRVL